MSQIAARFTTLIEDPDTGIDSQVVFQQINATDRWRMVRLAARDLFYDERVGYVQFDIKITRKLRVVVKLGSDDLYAVEVGQLKTVDYMPTYRVLDQVRGIDAGQLGETVERMCVAQSQTRRK